MATLQRNSYYLDDWDKIDDTYQKYMANHQQQIDTLQHWTDKQPHIPTLTRSTLAMFYNWAGESTEAAKQLLDSYLTLKTRNPDKFVARCAQFDKAEQQLDLVEVSAPDPWDQSIDGNRLTFIRLKDTDATKLDFHQAMKAFTASIDFEFARVGLYVKGLIGVFDMTGFHLGYFPKLNVMDIAVTLKYMQIFEKKVTSLHIINCNGLISQVMNLIRPFLSRELSKKLNFYTPNQMEEFYKVVPKKYVPANYGGEQCNMSEFNAVFRKRFRTAEEWLNTLDSDDWKVKDELRLVQDGQEEMKGSFRKLSID